MYAAQIPTGELRAQDLPTTYGDWSDYARFAVTFAPKDREGCREFATSAFARWRRTGEVPRTLQELRAPRREGAPRLPLVRAAPLALHGPRARRRGHAVRRSAHPRDAERAA